MINTRMNVEEIYKEYLRDQAELSRRTKSYLYSKEKLLKNRWKRTGDGEVQLSTPRNTLVSGNRYRQAITVSYNKTGWTSFKATTYMFIPDCSTGKMRVWMFVPEKKTVLEFSPKFLRKVCSGESYLESADEFMKDPKTYHFYKTENDELEIVIDEEMIGFGKLMGDLYMVDNLLTPEELETIRIELGKDGDPLEMYKEWKNLKSAPKEYDLESLDEESRKKAEIEMAWREFASY